MTEKCATCKFYTEDPIQVGLYGITSFVGICRQDKPTVILTASNMNTFRPVFPPCKPDAWCGKWQAI